MSNHRGYLSSLYEINWLPKNYFVTQEAGLPFKCFFFSQIDAYTKFQILIFHVHFCLHLLKCFEIFIMIFEIHWALFYSSIFNIIN